MSLLQYAHFKTAFDLTHLELGKKPFTDPKRTNKKLSLSLYKILYIYRTPNSMHIWWQGQHFQGCKRRNSGTGLDDGPENTPIFS
jgi:hypothetical protein